MADFPTSIVSPTDPISSNTLNSPSHSAQHQSHNGEIVAIETKLGTGSATPSTGAVLVGNGSGTSTWDTSPGNLTLDTPTLNTPDLNGTELILDADADTSITADTDDTIDIKIAGADDFQITANNFKALSGSSISTDTISETGAGSGVTADGLNIKDGKLNTSDSVVTANITNSAVTTDKILDDAVTSAKTNIIPTVDADDWNIADFGTFKIYTKQFTGVTTGSTGGNSSAATSVQNTSFPTGVAPNAVTILCDGYTTDGATRWKFFVEGYTASSAGTTDDFDINARNLTTSTITMTGGVCNVMMIGKA